jgi:hypothetical protein
MSITRPTDRQQVTVVPQNQLDYDLNQPSREADPSSGQLYGREDRLEMPSAFDSECDVPV